MTFFLYALNIYAWVAMIGFPLIGMCWALHERKISNQDYNTGHDDGWIDAIEQHDEQRPDCDWPALEKSK